MKYLNALRTFFIHNFLSSRLKLLETYGRLFLAFRPITKKSKRELLNIEMFVVWY